jgi:hypothetical protein
MARKDRSIAGFGEVAGGEDIIGKSDKVNVNDNININSILNEEPKKELVGIYFDPEVKRILQEVTKKSGRGAQSKLVNEAVKRLLQESGFM